MIYVVKHFNFAVMILYLEVTTVKNKFYENNPE